MFSSDSGISGERLFKLICGWSRNDPFRFFCIAIFIGIIRQPRNSLRLKREERKSYKNFVQLELYVIKIFLLELRRNLTLGVDFCATRQFEHALRSHCSDWCQTETFDQTQGWPNSYEQQSADKHFAGFASLLKRIWHKRWCVENHWISPSFCI